MYSGLCERSPAGEDGKWFGSDCAAALGPLTGAGEASDAAWPAVGDTLWVRDAASLAMLDDGSALLDAAMLPSDPGSGDDDEPAARVVFASPARVSVWKAGSRLVRAGPWVKAESLNPAVPKSAASDRATATEFGSAVTDPDAPLAEGS
ncbi:hypothetical protein ACU4GR_10655 (plasmid) [Methylobacterium oryzae CBMB20]